MDTLIPKSQMTEEDVKLNFITPALVNRGWNNKITMETMVKFTDGKINLRGNLVTRSNPKKADYILYFCANNPIAVVEANPDLANSFGNISFSRVLSSSNKAFICDIPSSCFILVMITAY